MMWIDRMGRYADVKGKSSTMTLRRSLANLGIDSLDRKVLLRQWSRQLMETVMMTMAMTMTMMMTQNFDSPENLRIVNLNC